MTRQKIICLVAVITLSQNLNLVKAYGTSGTGTTTSSPNDHDHNEQWGGIGQGQQQSNREHSSGNYGQAGQQTSDRYGNNDDSQQANHFARQSHLERYGYPDHCVHQSDPRKKCKYYVEISKEPEDPYHLHFELSGHIKEPEKGGYVGMGLSMDKMMGEDHIVECTKSANGNTRAYHSWSMSKSQQPERLRDDTSIIAMEDTYPRYDEKEKVLTCKFKRPVLTHVNIPNGPPVTFDLERGKYYVLLAVGPMANVNSDVIGFHGSKPLQSGDAYVSPYMLGYSEEQYPSSGFSGDNGHRNGSCGLAVGSFAVLFTVLMLFYWNH